MASSAANPRNAGAAKLCKRTYFLSRDDSVPRQTEMRHELGTDVANIILDYMSPACRAWMGVDRKLLGPAVYCIEPEELKANIHEHILHVGEEAELCAKRERRRNRKRKDCSEEFEFIRFECRQKIEIARDEERKRMQEQLRNAEMVLEEKFRNMKVELGEDYLKGRKEMAKFMCKNLRKQAQDLIGNIAKRYREELEHEVTRRVTEQVDKVNDQLSEIVQTAVDKQKAVDAKAMQKMCLRYEELVRNIQHRAACQQLTALTQQMCAKWAEICKPADNPAMSCQTSFVFPEVEVETDFETESESSGQSNEFLENDDIFVIETCPTIPGPSPTFSFTSSSSSSEQETAPPSFSTLEAFAFDGNVYAQPKYYHKIHEQLFPTPTTPIWEPTASSLEQFSAAASIEELPPVDSDFTREIVDQVLAQQDVFQEEVQLSSVDLAIDEVIDDSVQSIQSGSSETTVSGLFYLEKSQSAMDIVVNGITLKYIRATEKDFN